LAELRARLGPERPIVVSLDCHANLTERMTDAADAFAAYRTCPHVDTRRTGEQAGRILAAALAGEARPVTAVASRPMITPPDLHDSSRDPFRRLMALNDEIAREGALASCLLPVPPWVDVPGLSWKAAVTGDAGAYNERTSLAARVERVYDGEVVYTHPVNAGYRAATGPAALLRGRGGLQVVVHTRSVGVIDPALFVALGADPAQAAVLQAKSHVSYKAGFDPITTRSVVA